MPNVNVPRARLTTHLEPQPQPCLDPQQMYILSYPLAHSTHPPTTGQCLEGQRARRRSSLGSSKGAHRAIRDTTYSPLCRKRNSSLSLERAWILGRDLSSLPPPLQTARTRLRVVTADKRDWRTAMPPRVVNINQSDTSCKRIGRCSISASPCISLRIPGINGSLLLVA